MSAALRAAAQLLKACDAELHEHWECNSYHPSLVPAVEALRAALDEPAQKPVAWALHAFDRVQKIVMRADVADELACKWRESDPEAKAVPLYAAPQAVAPLTEKPADPSRLAAVRAAIHAYHSALDRRQHAGVAQGHAMQAIEEAMDMPWIQGATLPERGIGGGK